jgi:hypothetical protein
MTTFGEFKTLLLHALGAEPNTTYSDALLWDATCGALDAILPWCPNQKYDVLTSGSGSEIELPSDCYEVEAVVDIYSGIVLERAILVPGKSRPTANVAKRSPYDWMEYPRGFLNFSITPEGPVGTTVDETGVVTSGSGREFGVYYKAIWPKPANSSDDSFAMPMPQISRTGMIFWASAYAVTASGVVSSQIRQFNTKVDSGTPEDNVLEETVKHLRALFIEEMNRLPKYRGHAT